MMEVWELNMVLRKEGHCEGRTTAATKTIEHEKQGVWKSDQEIV